MTKKTPLLHHFTQTLVWHYDFWSETCNCSCRVDAKPGGTRMRAGGEVKGKEANGVGSH